jgi:hypothetical protein
VSSENTAGEAGPPHTDLARTDPPCTDPLRADPPPPDLPPPGLLRNGNPRGNPNLVSRCGAKTRAPRSGPCQAPAMANGRCRLHGGLSTGPRTVEGLARLRAVKTKHGYYSAENRAARRRLAALVAEMRALLVRQQVGAHAVETVAADRMRGAEGGPEPQTAQRGAMGLRNVRKAAE